MLRECQIMQLECYNDGIEVAKFYQLLMEEFQQEAKSMQVGRYVLCADDNKSSFWINGVRKPCLCGRREWRAFSQMLRISTILALVASDHEVLRRLFSWYIDDFYIYDRALSSSEIII